MMPVTPLRARDSEVSTGPISAMSSSWQILTKWSSARTRIVSSFFLATSCTFSPSAFSFTF